MRRSVTGLVGPRIKGNTSSFDPEIPLHRPGTCWVVLYRFRPQRWVAGVRSSLCSCGSKGEDRYESIYVVVLGLT